MPYITIYVARKPSITSAVSSCLHPKRQNEDLHSTIIRSLMAEHSSVSSTNIGVSVSKGVPSFM